MGRTAAGRIVVATGLVLAVTALAGCGSAASDRDGSSPESSGSARPSPTSPPSTAPSTPTVDWSVGGWDIHYRENGRIKVLKVEDFPR